MPACFLWMRCTKRLHIIIFNALINRRFLYPLLIWAKEPFPIEMNQMGRRFRDPDLRFP